MASDSDTHSIVPSESSSFTSSLSQLIHNHPERTLTWSHINVKSREDVSWIGWLLREKSFGSETLLQDSSGIARPGEVLGVVGASGVGKSTLLRVLSGQDSTSGTVITGECCLDGSLTTRSQRTQGSVMGYVDEYETFCDTSTVEEHLVFNAMLRLKKSKNDKQRRERAHLVMKLFLLERVANTVTKELSSGERKRLSIASAFLTNPSIILFDEPVCDVDSCTAKMILDMIRTMAVDYRRTIIIAVRRPNKYMLDILDSMCLLVHGGYQAFFGNTNEATSFFTNTLNLSASSLEQCLEEIMEKTEVESEISNTNIAKLDRCSESLISDILKKCSINDIGDQKA